MKRARLVSISMFLFLSAALLQAQRGGGFSGGAAGFGGGGHGPHGGFGNKPGNQVTLRGGFGHRRGNGTYYGAYLPYWGYADYSDYDFPAWDYVNFPPTTDAPEAGYQQPAAPVMMTRNDRYVEREPAPQSPKLVEVPLAPNSSVRVQPPGLFVLNNGERIESERYVLTAKSLTVDVGRQQRSIPLSELNADETIAANHARGVELTIPRDRNSLFLSF